MQGSRVLPTPDKAAISDGGVSPMEKKKIKNFEKAEDKIWRYATGTPPGTYFQIVEPLEKKPDSDTKS
jgi:hypothetical protein